MWGTIGGLAAFVWSPSALCSGAGVPFAPNATVPLEHLAFRTDLLGWAVQATWGGCSTRLLPRAAATRPCRVPEVERVAEQRVRGRGGACGVPEVDCHAATVVYSWMRPPRRS
jgi:hypothetical protein